MLGRKTGPNQFISQATVAHKITANTWPKRDGKQRAFTPFYDDANYEFVGKIIINAFNAFRSVYPEVWEDKNGLAKKVIGYSAIMNFLISLMNYEKFLSSDNLQKIFINVGINLSSDDKMKTSLFKTDINLIINQKNVDFNNKIMPIMKELFSNEKGSSESIAKQIGNELFESYLDWNDVNKVDTK